MMQYCLQLPRVGFPVSSRLTSELELHDLKLSYSSSSSCSWSCSCSAGKSKKLRMQGAGAESVIFEEDEITEGAETMPKHVAVIMDGNGRWAKNRNLPIQYGHRAGWETLARLISKCCQLRINTLSVFTFSKDNWKRPQMEVDLLMRAFENYIQTEIKQLITRYEMRFSAIGKKSRLPESLQWAINSSEEMSKGKKGMHCVMVVNYSGRDDVVEAAKSIATKVEGGIIRAGDVDVAMMEEHLMTNILEFPNPDLLIRTSGEQRVSNFLLWQLAYTEFYMVDLLFPDFDETHLLQALSSYQRRQRRYGARI